MTTTTLPVLAPTASILNPSTRRQVRWCVVPMPLQQAAALPDVCLVDGRFLAVKGERIGTVSQLWCVRADVGGLATLDLRDWQPHTGTLPPFAMSSWVTDAPRRLVPRFGISVNGQWRLNLELRNGVIVEQNAAAQVWEFRESRGGWHAVIWATFWSGQDTVDLEGAVVWSDPNSTAWSIGDAGVSLEIGEWPTVGEALAIYHSARVGFQRWGPERGGLYRGPLPHGTGVTFRGALLCGNDGRVPVTEAEIASGPSREWREGMLAAAAEAPLVGVARWDQNWMAFGVVPSTAQRANVAAVRGFFQGAGNLMDPRPLANNGAHSSTGMQPPFGAVKDVVALQGDPWRVWELLYSATDYWMRGCHHRELDGRRVTKALRPTFQTWAGCIEPNESPDTLGKPRGPAPDGWHQIGARSVLMDDQHRGSKYLELAYALTGSRLLRECLLDLLAVDECRAMPARGWYDAPRATGRLWQSWAAGMCLFTGAERDRFAALALNELADRERDLAAIPGPVKVMQTIRDDRVIPNREAVVPWNNALGCLGALEVAAAFVRIGRPADAERFRNFARTIGRALVQFGTVSTPTATHPISGLLWVEGGEAQPASYYAYPPERADLRVDLGANWWPWWSGALAAAQLAPLDDVSAKAAAIWSANFSTDMAAPGLAGEWWACR